MFNFLKKIPLRVALQCATLCVVTVCANVSVTTLFSNSMVLQRNTSVPIFGKASSGESVTVTFNGQTKTTTTSSSGTWKVSLDPMPEGGPYTLTIKGNNTINPHHRCVYGRGLAMWWTIEHGYPCQLLSSV